MKKLFCIMLALAFLALAACGVSETPVGTPEAAPTATAEPPVESPEEPSEAPWPPSEIDAAETVLELAVEWVSEEDMTGEELMPAYTDAVGGTMGPADFDVDGGDVYILNTADNSVYVCSGGELARRIDLDVTGLYAIRMAAEDGNVYIFGVEQESRRPAFAAVDAEGRAQSLPFMEHLSSESVAGLSANGSELYVEEGGRYWTFDLENPDAAPESSEAYRLADGTLWEPHFAGNGILTHTMTLDVTHPDGRTLTIPFEAACEHAGMGGLRLLRCGGGQYDVYVVEITQDEEYWIHTAEYVLRVDEKGTPLYVYTDSSSAELHNTRLDSGALYSMGVDGSTLSIKRLPDVFTTPWARYESPLAGITPPSPEPEPTQSAGPAPAESAHQA